MNMSVGFVVRSRSPWRTTRSWSGLWRGIPWAKWSNVSPRSTPVENMIHRHSRNRGLNGVGNSRRSMPCRNHSPSTPFGTDSSSAAEFKGELVQDKIISTCSGEWHICLSPSNRPRGPASSSSNRVHGDPAVELCLSEHGTEKDPFQWKEAPFQNGLLDLFLQKDLLRRNCAIRIIHLNGPTEIAPQPWRPFMSTIIPL